MPRLWARPDALAPQTRGPAGRSRRVGPRGGGSGAGGRRGGAASGRAADARRARGRYPSLQWPAAGGRGASSAPSNNSEPAPAASGGPGPGALCPTGSKGPRARGPRPGAKGTSGGGGSAGREVLLVLLETSAAAPPGNQERYWGLEGVSALLVSVVWEGVGRGGGGREGGGRTPGDAVAQRRERVRGGASVRAFECVAGQGHSCKWHITAYFVNPACRNRQCRMSPTAAGECAHTYAPHPVARARRGGMRGQEGGRGSNRILPIPSVDPPPPRPPLPIPAAICPSRPPAHVHRAHTEHTAAPYLHPRSPVPPLLPASASRLHRRPLPGGSAEAQLLKEAALRPCCSPRRRLATIYSERPVCRPHLAGLCAWPQQ